MKGCYCLIIELEKDSNIVIGKKLGNIQFDRGYYVYVGSAMNSLEKRIERHLSEEKKLHWHIDYILKDPKSRIVDVIFNIDVKVECEISKYLSKQGAGIKDFGCSDCDCESHLYYFKNRKDAIESVENAYNSIAMEFRYLEDKI